MATLGLRPGFQYGNHGFMDVAHPLKNWRSRLGLTQGAAAERLGLTEPTLCRYETGSRKPSPARAAQLSEKTGIPIADLRPDLAGFVQEAAQ